MPQLKNNYIYIFYFILLVSLFFLAYSFSIKKDVDKANVKFIKTSFINLPGWDNDFNEEVKTAFISSCNEIKKKSHNIKILSFENYKFFCENLNSIKNKKSLRLAIEKYFDPYFIKAQNHEAKFTGYVEIIIKGRKNKDFVLAPSSVPILAKPKNMVSINLNDFNQNYGEVTLKGIIDNDKIRPLPTRKEIETQNLFKENVLAYIDDPAQAFFLHVQGSGRLLFPDGQTMYVGYAENNGRPYTSIGKELINRGEILKEDVSMQSIQAWMKNNLNKAQSLRHLNDRYIFFEERKTEEVIGASKVSLTPMFSAAVDNKYYPFHLPFWVEVDSFAKEKGKKVLLRTLFLAQDSGGAIKGPLRFDLFLGHGEKEEKIAGSLNSKGRAWVLIPKTNKKNKNYFN